MLHSARSAVRAAVAGATLVLGAPLIGAGPRTASPDQRAHRAAERIHTVIIEGLRYRPQVIVVRRGERVRWINEDPIPHTVTAIGGGFDSHSIPPEGSWTYVPAKTGEYDYACTFHPTMKGKLQVR